MTSTPSAATPKPVVTIYGTYGAGARQVGRAVARELGLPFFGPAFSSEAIEGGSEEVRAREATFLTKVIALMAAAFGASVIPEGSLEGHRQELIAENHRQVQGCAHLGGVMVGRHGALLLADRPNTVHVLLTGSVEDRVERAAADRGSRGSMPPDAWSVRTTSAPTWRSRCSAGTPGSPTTTTWS